MALPFYNQGDQDIYAGGDHFIPQQDYRLNYTPSTTLASTVGNTGGVTDTQAATPYIWPPQGSGGGGGGGDPFGPNAITKDFNVRQWDGTKYVDDTVTGYKTPSGWKTAKDKNIFHAGGRFPSPLNFMRTKLRNWKKNREIKKQEKIVADKAATDATGPRWRTEGGGQGTPGAGGENVRSSSGDTYGGEAFGYNEAAEKSDYYKHGGRIGYANRGFVDPEEPAENMFEFMRDQNIPLNEQVEGEEGILEQLIAKYIEEGFPPDQAEAMAMQEFEQMTMGPEQDQGIASLV
jgi:hypothetical protein